MPLKRKAQTARRRPRLASDAAVRAELGAMLDRMPEPTPGERRRRKKGDARFARWREEGHAVWDAMTPTERAEAAAEILRTMRRYDSDADERDLGADGGRSIFGIDHACDRQAKRWARQDAKRPKVDTYAAHRAGYTGPASPAKTAAVEAVRAAPALSETTTLDESPEPKKTRRRRPAGVAGYIDPRLIDDDDYWED
ncbi:MULTISPECIES: hypothetical protein [unclassified Microbacterium]|uniref:hypothetical protein n=1 Tax=unclassified Microbacterium TaxID=2609290 RepID=UPI0012F968C0|nr:hypothetical protein [Microbacterium sp. MAH-37]MVQ42957.1 hypothetical protein [Microbacterium sp. MAH-37]